MQTYVQYVHTVDHRGSFMVSALHDDIQQTFLCPAHGGVYVTTFEPDACNGVVIVGSGEMTATYVSVIASVLSFFLTNAAPCTSELLRRCSREEMFANTEFFQKPFLSLFSTRDG